MTLPGAVDKKYLRCLAAAVIAALVLGQDTVAQISSGSADHVDTLTYLPGNPAEDPLFVFYQPESGSNPGSLTATYQGAGPFNFEWSRYNPAVNGFDPAFSSETGAGSSTVSNLDEGGYRVRIWNETGTDVTYMSWVMLDHLRDSVVQTSEGTLPGFLYTCDFVAIAGYVFPDTFKYWDLVSHKMITRVLDYSFKWTSDNNELDIPNDTLVLRPNISYKPPYKDTEYYLTATDEFGMTAVDQVFYESIQTSASFSMEYLDKVTGEYTPDLSGDWSPGEGSLDAMLTVRFINESLNGESYQWVYLDTVGGVLETETTYDLETVTEFTYETADEYYYPYMISISEENCTDTFRVAEGIHVAPSQLEIPNVFSPNGDGINDYFVFKHQSLESCRVTIVDRTGKMVYKRKIQNIYSWDGWDGNMHDSNRKAPEGQYYFVVEAMGYDGMEFSDPNIIEQWKLNRGNNTTGSTTGTGTSGTQTGEEDTNRLYTGWLYLYRHKGEL
ncbi:MAG: gliding motility-associated C-terminal domain-containing protein [Bacteroidales bacterium]|nr:gliding motility-associated C-terminal domain-containing protein [Bacteroidales bacterium]